MDRALTATSMLILSRSDVMELLSLHDCIEAVELAFQLHAQGRTFGPGVLGIRVADGSFHIKVPEPLLIAAGAACLVIVTLR